MNSDKDCCLPPPLDHCYIPLVVFESTHFPTALPAIYWCSLLIAVIWKRDMVSSCWHFIYIFPISSKLSIFSYLISWVAIYFNIYMPRPAMKAFCEQPSFIFTIRVSHFTITVINTWYNQLRKRKGCIRLVVLVVSGHDQLALQFDSGARQHIMV